MHFALAKTQGGRPTTVTTAAMSNDSPRTSAVPAPSFLPHAEPSTSQGVDATHADASTSPDADDHDGVAGGSRITIDDYEDVSSEDEYQRSGSTFTMALGHYFFERNFIETSNNFQTSKAVIEYVNLKFVENNFRSMGLDEMFDKNNIMRAEMEFNSFELWFVHTKRYAVNKEYIRDLRLPLFCHLYLNLYVPRNHARLQALLKTFEYLFSSPKGAIYLEELKNVTDALNLSPRLAYFRRNKFVYGVSPMFLNNLYDFFQLNFMLQVVFQEWIDINYICYEDPKIVFDEHYTNNLERVNNLDKANAPKINNNVNVFRTALCKKTLNSSRNKNNNRKVNNSKIDPTAENSEQSITKDHFLVPRSRRSIKKNIKRKHMRHDSDRFSSYERESRRLKKFCVEKSDDTSLQKRSISHQKNQKLSEESLREGQSSSNQKEVTEKRIILRISRKSNRLHVIASNEKKEPNDPKNPLKKKSNEEQISNKRKKSCKHQKKHTSRGKKKSISNKNLHENSNKISNNAKKLRKKIKSSDRRKSISDQNSHSRKKSSEISDNDDKGRKVKRQKKSSGSKSTNTDNNMQMSESLSEVSDNEPKKNKKQKNSGRRKSKNDDNNTHMNESLSEVTDEKKKKYKQPKKSDKSKSISDDNMHTSGLSDVTDEEKKIYKQLKKSDKSKSISDDNMHTSGLSDVSDEKKKYKQPKKSSKSKSISDDNVHMSGLSDVTDEEKNIYKQLKKSDKSKSISDDNMHTSGLSDVSDEKKKYKQPKKSSKSKSISDDNVHMSGLSDVTDEEKNIYKQLKKSDKSKSISDDNMHTSGLSDVTDEEKKKYKQPKKSGKSKSISDDNMHMSGLSDVSDEKKKYKQPKKSSKSKSISDDNVHMSGLSDVSDEKNKKYKQPKKSGKSKSISDDNMHMSGVSDVSDEKNKKYKQPKKSGKSKSISDDNMHMSGVSDVSDEKNKKYKQPKKSGKSKSISDDNMHMSGVSDVSDEEKKKYKQPKKSGKSKSISDDNMHKSGLSDISNDNEKKQKLQNKRCKTKSTSDDNNRMSQISNDEKTFQKLQKKKKIRGKKISDHNISDSSLCGSLSEDQESLNKDKENHKSNARIKYERINNTTSLSESYSVGDSLEDSSSLYSSSCDEEIVMRKYVRNNQKSAQHLRYENSCHLKHIKITKIDLKSLDEDLYLRLSRKIILKNCSKLSCSILTFDQNLVVAGSIDSLIYLWERNNEKSCDILHTIGNINPSNFASSVQGNNLVEYLDKNKAFVLRGHGGPIFDLAELPSAKILLSASNDKTYRAWDMVSKRCLEVYNEHEHRTWCIAASPYSLQVATGSCEGASCLWFLNYKRPLRMFMGHLDDILVLKFHPNQVFLATGSSDKTIRVFELTSGNCHRILTGHSDYITCLEFNAENSNYLASASGNGEIIVWDVPSGEIVWKIGVGNVLFSDLAWLTKDVLLASLTSGVVLKCDTTLNYTDSSCKVYGFETPFYRLISLQIINNIVYTIGIPDKSGSLKPLPKRNKEKASEMKSEQQKSQRESSPLSKLFFPQHIIDNNGNSMRPLHGLSSTTPNPTHDFEYQINTNGQFEKSTLPNFLSMNLKSAPFNLTADEISKLSSEYQSENIRLIPAVTITNNLQNAYLLPVQHDVRTSNVNSINVHSTNVQLQSTSKSQKLIKTQAPTKSKITTAKQHNFGNSSLTMHTSIQHMQIKTTTIQEQLHLDDHKETTMLVQQYLQTTTSTITHKQQNSNLLQVTRPGMSSPLPQNSIVQQEQQMQLQHGIGSNSHVAGTNVQQQQLVQQSRSNKNLKKGNVRQRSSPLTNNRSSKVTKRSSPRQSPNKSSS